MATIGVEKGRTAFYAHKINSRKNHILFVERAYDAECDDGPCEKIKIDRVAFFRDEESVKIFEDALRRMFTDGGAKIVTRTEEITLDIDMED